MNFKNFHVSLSFIKIVEIFGLILVIENYYRTVILMKELLKEQNIIIDKFYLFGSRARNENSEDSDYDFLIVVKNDLNSSEKRKIIADLYRFLIKNNGLILMDLIIKTSNKFYSECQELGYLSYTVFKEGIEIE